MTTTFPPGSPPRSPDAPQRVAQDGVADEIEHRVPTTRTRGADLRSKLTIVDEHLGGAVVPARRRPLGSSSTTPTHSMPSTGFPNDHTPGAHVGVGVIEPEGANADEDLARARGGVRQVAGLKDLGTPL